MSDDELSEERKHKEHKKHKSSKRHKSGTRDRSRHDRDRRDHGSRDTAPQSTTGPCWQTMQFKLIDGVNRYNVRPIPKYMKVYAQWAWVCISEHYRQGRRVSDSLGV